ncbi:MAG: sugar phosphate nucleotidyltransferase [Oscillospiraceae bacterium]
MQAVILCGGKEDNLMPMTERTPLCLLRLTGKPIIKYVLDSLKRFGFHETTLAVGYLGNMVKSEIGDNYNGLTINYTKICRDGTANAILNGYRNDDMLVIEANSIFDFNLEEIVDYYILNKPQCLLVTKKTKDFSNYICFSSDDNDKVLSIKENPAFDDICANNVYTGIYILSKDIIEKYDFQNNESFLHGVLPEIISEKRDNVILYDEKGYWNKITDSVTFLKCQHDILDGSSGINIGSKNQKNNVYSDTDNNFNGVSIIPPVYIGKNVTLKEGSVIGPFSVIDDNTVIANRVKTDFCYIGQNSVIKPRTEITTAVICSNVIVNSSSYCGDYAVIGESSTIGENVRVENGAKIWGKREIRNNAIIKNDIKHGIGIQFLIDDESECSFGHGKNLPIDMSRLGMAIGTALNKTDAVIVGYSDSNSAKSLSDCLISGILSTGVKVYSLSECTREQLMFSIGKLSGKIGCYISADYSVKVKLMDVGGLNIDRYLESKIEKSYNNDSFRSTEYCDYGISYEFTGAKQLYNDYLNSIMQAKFNGVNAEIKCSSILTAKLADSIIRPRNDINGERIVFHISADGSSCSVYTEETGYVSYDRLILLALKICIDKKIPVSIPYYFPSEAEKLADSYNGKIYRYFCGTDDDTDIEANSIAKRPDNLFVRDGLMLTCIICRYLSDNNLSLAEALKCIPVFTSVQRYVNSSANPTDLMKIFHSPKSKRRLNRIYSDKGTNAMIKPLKNGMGIMIYAESYKAEQAAAVCDEIQEKLKKFENNISV